MSGSPFGILEAQASEHASDAQLQAANKAADVQLQMYNQSRADLAPWREAGAGAINALWGTPGTPATQAQTIQGAPIYGNAVSGSNADTGHWAIEMQYDMSGGTPGGLIPKAVWVGPGESSSNALAGGQQITGYQPSTTIPASAGTPGTQGLIQAGPGEFKESPSYQFVLGEGLKGIQRGASASGRLASGNYLKDITKYSEGLASTEYQNFLNRYYQSLTPYQSLAGIGQTSAGQTAASGVATGNALANTYMNAGEAQAAGILGQYNSYANSMGNTGNQVGNYLMQMQPWAQTAGTSYSGYGYSNPAYSGFLYGGGGAAAGASALTAADMAYMAAL
jgi:hypothetical protein